MLENFQQCHMGLMWVKQCHVYHPVGNCWYHLFMELDCFVTFMMIQGDYRGIKNQQSILHDTNGLFSTMVC